MKHLCLLLLLALSLPAAPPQAFAAESLMLEDFEQGIGPEWQHKEFEGHTDYRILELDGNRVLEAESRASASGLFLEKNYSLKDWPSLSWRWKVEGTVTGGDARTKKGDDYSARVYVVFPHWFFPKTRSINYIWANRLPKGESIPNPFIANAIMLAVESGPERAGEWITETRNVLEDYRLLFGEEPPDVGAIAIMTDTDNTSGSARAWYDDLKLESK